MTNGNSNVQNVRCNRNAYVTKAKSNRQNRNWKLVVKEGNKMCIRTGVHTYYVCTCTHIFMYTPRILVHFIHIHHWHVHEHVYTFVGLWHVAICHW